VQGRDAEVARQIKADALALQEAGAVMLVLECVPRALAAEIANSLRIPVIGIGAGADCDGQVLVLHDMLGIGVPHKFTRDFMTGGGTIAKAISNYVRAVKNKDFPGLENGFD